MAALYNPAPTTEQLSAEGVGWLSPEDYPPHELWAENWPAISFYRKWSSQWNVVAGMSGAHYIGLNFGVLLPLLDRLDLTRDEYDDMLGCLREIESEARKHLNAA